MNVKVEISKILKKLSISPDLSGYAYLRDAIWMVMNDETILHSSTTKILYPAVALRYNTTPARVERAIRRAVETCGFKADDLELYDDIFGNITSLHKECPTNSQFIGCVADYLVLAQEMEQSVNYESSKITEQ